MIKKYTDSNVTGIAVQNGNYHGETGNSRIPEEPLENRVQDLYEYAKSILKVDFIFWAKQEPYFTKFVAPAIGAKEN